MGAAATGMSSDDDGDMLAPVAAASPPLPVIPRGATPPPHDYVLGAGPAATRNDFDNLHARFEREEIGDNSAVLGVDRSAPAILAAEAATATDAHLEVLPDRQEMVGGATAAAAPFETQEQMMAGGDGSGAISDAALNLAAHSIAEEGGDVPSLERDPIDMSTDRDGTTV